MQIIGVARLGKDCELRHIQSGDAVTNLSLAYNYGKKDQQGNRPSQWIEGVLWGKRAEGLVQYLIKGQQVCVTLDDVHTEQYTKNDGGTGFKLVGTVTNIEFVGSKPDNAGQQQQTRPAAAPAPAQRPAAPPAQRRGHPDDMDDDIPF
jgi:single-strand DNA-binding protein